MQALCALKEDWANGEGWEVLTRAAMDGHGDEVKLLIEAGANTDKAQGSWATPLCFATQIWKGELR